MFRRILANRGYPNKSRLRHWVECPRKGIARIYNTASTIGFIVWSDDKRLDIKVLDLNMTVFKRFVCQGVELARAWLHELLLIHQNEAREAKLHLPRNLD